MANASQDTSTGAHAGHWTSTATKAGTYEFATGGKYVDRNIDLVIPAGSLSTSGTASGTISTVTVSETKNSDGKYPVTGSGSLSGTSKTAGTAGWITPGATGAVSGTANINATIPAGAIATSGTANASITTIAVGTKANGKYPITGSGSVSGTASASVSTTGYVVKGTQTASGAISGTASLSGTSLAAASATVSGSATVKPNGLSAASGNAKIASAATTTQPTSGYYVAATPSTAASTAISQSKKINTAGYLGDAAEISASGTVTGGAGSKYYIPITSSSLGNSAKDGITYTENTSIIIPSEGALYIEEGYTPAIKITLDQMLDGKDDTAGTSAPDIRSGKIAYDVDGKKLTGTMPNASRSAGAGNVSATSDNVSLGDAVTTKPESGYYITAQGSGTVSTGTGYITAGSTTSNTATKYYPVTASAVSGSDATGTATASANTTHNLVSGTFATSATAGYTYHVDATASASSPKVTATKSITAGYTGAKSVTATVNAASSGNKASSIYIKDGVITNNTSGGTSSGTISAGKQIKIAAGYYAADKYYTAADSAGALTKQAITGSLTVGAITEGYTAPTLVTDTSKLTAYVAISGNGSMTAGNVYNGTANAATKYMEVYSGTYTIS